MKLVNADFGIRIKFIENRVNVLVIENPRDLSATIQDLLNQMNGEDGNYIFSNDEKEIEIKKDIEFIMSPFTLSMNERKIKKAL